MPADAPRYVIYATDTPGLALYAADIPPEGSAPSAVRRAIVGAGVPAREVGATAEGPSSAGLYALDLTPFVEAVPDGETAPVVVWKVPKAGAVRAWGVARVDRMGEYPVVVWEW